MNNVLFDTVPEYYNYHPSLKGNISLTLFPEPMLVFSVVRSTLKWRILRPAVAWPDRHDVHVFFIPFISRVPNFWQHWNDKFCGQRWSDRQAWCSRFFIPFISRVPNFWQHWNDKCCVQRWHDQTGMMFTVIYSFHLKSSPFLTRLKWQILRPSAIWPDRHDVHGFSIPSISKVPHFWNWNWNAEGQKLPTK